MQLNHIVIYWISLLFTKNYAINTEKILAKNKMQMIIYASNCLI